VCGRRPRLADADFDAERLDQAHATSVSAPAEATWELTSLLRHRPIGIHKSLREVE
jgi:hypothetical protein